MFKRHEPELAQWYGTPDGGSFEVVAIDEGDGTIEVQYLDGAIEEIDMESWHQLCAVPRAEPDDWASPYDDLDREDGIPDDDAIFHPDTSWEEQVDGLE